ncbi:hypothetical protein ZIOFF_051243 [Zingiber officinale]|uniref:non-specific serine/threonine protein kinase n=2 Tax=Zingiber officinale TaxID=94328 RepID=A0A8J5KMS6_ZINOF|nr:hypothetical protein ZIOFF_051243 [Zingiber officinale]
MEANAEARFTLGKLSSLAPECDGSEALFTAEAAQIPEDISSGIRLMFLANEGDLDGIREALGSRANVDFKDIDGRTALHVAASQGYADVVELLILNGADVDTQDRWGSTPLADAIHYKNREVIKLLEKHGAKLKVVPMHVENAREVPEYEIDPRELDFTNSIEITKGTFRIVTWRGIQVAVKKFNEDMITDEDKLRAFRDELELLQQIRHPNVVQFLGAVTQSSPMMIVTEYLAKGDLCDFLKSKKSLSTSLAVRHALDISRGLNYLHEHKPEPIIHRDLEPSNILIDDTGHLKVADFGVSKLLRAATTVQDSTPLTCLDTAYRYMAPEVFLNQQYDTKVDVFSFSLILQEMIEGGPPFSYKQDTEVLEAYASKERPAFRASNKRYAHGLKELIEQCWSHDPKERPAFSEIIDRLCHIHSNIGHKHSKAGIFSCCQNLNLWKKDSSNSSGYSSHSSDSTMGYSLSNNCRDQHLLKIWNNKRLLDSMKSKVKETLNPDHTKHLDTLIGPAVMLLYPLYASMRAIESPSLVDDQQWLTYWVIYSLITLFELSSWKVLHWFPLWPYMKLVFCLWLVLPMFNGAAYIYENHVRRYFRLGRYVSQKYPAQQRVVQMASLDARKSVEQFIDTYGPQSLERVVKAAEREARKH